MKFSINQTELNKNLKYLSGIAHKKQPIPTLMNLLLESVDQDKLKISASDSDNTLTVKIPCLIQEEGKLCISAAKTLSLVDLLPGQDLIFKGESNYSCTVKSGKSSYKILGIDPDDFPKINTEINTPYKIPGSILADLIKRTSFAITEEELKYTLSGAKLILSDNTTKMIATDGNRLAYINYTNPSHNFDTPLDILIPNKALVQLRNLAANCEKNIEFAADRNHLYCRSDNILLISRLLAGNFPDYSKVLLDNSNIFKSIELDKLQFELAIKRTRLMADQKSLVIKLNFSEDKLELISSSADEGSANEIVDIEYKGDPFEIAFRSNFIEQFLGILSEDKIYFEFEEDRKKYLMRENESSGYEYEYILLPVTIKSVVSS